MAPVGCETLFFPEPELNAEDEEGEDGGTSDMGYGLEHGVKMLRSRELCRNRIEDKETAWNSVHSSLWYDVI